MKKILFIGLLLMQGWAIAEECPYKGTTRPEIGAIIRERAEHYQVDPDLIWALVEVESYYDPCTVSEAGAMGLMQLMPGTAEKEGVTDPFNPQQNIDAGTRIISRHLKKYELLQYALAAYNAGEGAVLRYRRIPPYDQTKRYIRKIVKAYETRKGTRSEWLVWSKENAATK
jgi:soluble lytic murein transglycosylase-like protein